MRPAAAVLLALMSTVPLQALAQDCAPAEKLLSQRPFASWSDSHAYFVRYKGRCSDAALAEALSSRHTQLLDKTAPQIAGLGRLAASDPAYLDWLLLGVFYNPEEQEVNAKNTACRLLKRLKSCVPADKALCARLAARVGPSVEYVQACPT